jgi:two-component system sensor histidine kinase KdpD
MSPVLPLVLKSSRRLNGCWTITNPLELEQTRCPVPEALYIPAFNTGQCRRRDGSQPSKANTQLSIDARQLLETYATQIAFAIERNNLSERSQRAELESEAEKLRSSLLSAVSHDLRTPLAAIAGAASSLDANINKDLIDQANHDLLETIVDESQRLARLVENLLHMTRLSSGKCRSIVNGSQWRKSSGQRFTD